MVFALQFGYYVKGSMFTLTIAFWWIALAKFYNFNLKNMSVYILLSYKGSEAARKKFKK